MKFVFFEAPAFTRMVTKYLDDDEYRKLQKALMENPELGDVMTGTGGFRKVRWRNQWRGKGKRGGIRVIYYLLTAERQIWFFTIYGKDEAIDLAPAERRALKRTIQTELEARRRSND